MSENEGLTGIKEEARGFVGRRGGPKYDETKKGRPRMRFDIGCGVNDESNGKYVTWRHCIAYGKVADYLKEIKPGALVKVAGWLTTEAVLDEYYKPVKDDKGQIVTREYLIADHATIHEHEPLQKRLPLAVGQAIP